MTARATATQSVNFHNRTPSGAATVEFPLLIACSRCHGLRGYSILNSSGDREFIPDPVGAVRISLIQSGYNLRVNEERAARGSFARHTDHDGDSDSWQWADEQEPQACRCHGD